MDPVIYVGISVVASMLAGVLGGGIVVLLARRADQKKVLPRLAA